MSRLPEAERAALVENFQPFEDLNRAIGERLAAVKDETFGGFMDEDGMVDHEKVYASYDFNQPESSPFHAFDLKRHAALSALLEPFNPENGKVEHGGAHAAIDADGMVDTPWRIAAWLDGHLGALEIAERCARLVAPRNSDKLPHERHPRAPWTSHKEPARKLYGESRRRIEPFLRYAPSLASLLPELVEIQRRKADWDDERAEIVSCLEAVLYRMSRLDEPGADATPGIQTAPDSPALNRKKVVKRPPEEAFQAFRMQLLLGYTQAKIAEELAREHGMPFGQPKVSRYIKQASEFFKATGTTPPGLDSDHKPTAVAMDPRTLEQGPRRDGRGRSR